MLHLVYSEHGRRALHDLRGVYIEHFDSLYGGFAPAGEKIKTPFILSAVEE
jgi:hypothetical protein